jgi:hypothetical protein
VLTAVLVFAGPVVALTLARRAAGHPLVRFLLDLLTSALILARLVYRLVRFVCLFVVGEVRSWRLSRSLSRS